jgi:S1-C subfamily serine protease
LAIVTSSACAAPAQKLEDLIGAVVKIKAQINPEGTTVRGLGRDREGSGILIDADGLVLTIGYLMVEAYAAEIITNDGHTVPATIVGYDHETGFGLLRATEPLKAKPLPIGRSADVKVNEVAVVASGGGANMVMPVTVVAKREFVGDWEYLVDEALFTSPPHPAWSGAALISHEGKLVGVGSLAVGDAKEAKKDSPGNMFVPIDRLFPILGDLIADRESRHRPGRCHRDDQRRDPQRARRFLSQALVESRRRRGGARAPAPAQSAETRYQIDKPARSPEAEVQLLMLRLL